jgi:WD40 repeat protein
MDLTTSDNALPKSFGSSSIIQTNDPDMEKKAARKKREAEIAAMTASVMATPVSSSESKSKSTERQEQQQQEEDEEEESEEETAKDDASSRYNLPISHEVSMVGHRKPISCIAIDSPGSRFATGSMDYYVKLWDFGGMARHVRPFREIEIEEGHPIIALSYSPSGDRFLAATGSSQPKVLSREGVEELQFAKGDMYVVDMANTNGHTHTVTGGAWHPKLRDRMITSSLDGTIRLWQLDGKTTFDKLINSQVIKPKSKRGKRIGVTTCGFNLDGSLISCATVDGQILFFDPKKLYAGPSMTIKDAHTEGTTDLGISCVRMSPDGKHFASRSCSDETVKVWDLRKTSKPFKIFSKIESIYGTSNLAFNPQGTCVATGTSVRKQQGLKGQVVFFDVLTPDLYAPIACIDMKEDDSAICVEWHHGINQIFVGTSQSGCRVFYDPFKSKKGVLLTATTKSKVQQIEFGARIDGEGKVHVPHALPMFREEDSSHLRKYHKIRLDPKKSKAPEKPITGPGMGGKIAGNTTFTQYFLSSHIKKTFREEDPREAILKYAKKAKEDPQFTGKAYANSQPIEKIDPRYQLASETLEQEKITQQQEEQKYLQT